MSISKFRGEGAYRIRKSVLVFFVVRRLGLYELPVHQHRVITSCQSSRYKIVCVS
jgi:hypothetical protein